MAILIKGQLYDTMKEVCARSEKFVGRRFDILRKPFTLPPKGYPQGRQKEVQYFDDD
jgi:hypothetical protein